MRSLVSSDRAFVALIRSRTVINPYMRIYDYSLPLMGTDCQYPASKPSGTIGTDYISRARVAYIQRADRDEMCPMEKLSLGKAPETFYRLMKEIISQPQEISH